MIRETSAGRRSRPERWLVAVLLAAAGAWAIWSFATGGIMSALVVVPDGGDSLAALRTTIEGAGPLGPLVYIVAVVIEVVVAPLPGLLLYAPGGAIFGGWMGGTLSLIGNVAGAMLAAVIARVLGHRVTARLRQSHLDRHAERLRARGLVVIALLRVNPLTSSDLVSYASGLAGVPTWRVGVGTLVGLAPLCYAQAFAAEWLFDWLPASAPILVLSGVAYAVLVVWFLVRPRPIGVHSSTEPS